MPEKYIKINGRELPWKKIPKLSSFHTIKAIEEMSGLLQSNSMITYRAQRRAEIMF